MVNSKKNSKSLIALVVMAFLLVASIVLAATGAWFTSKVSDKSGSIQFGEITLADLVVNNPTATSVTKDTTPAIEGRVDLTDNLMPGDTLGLTFNVKNAADKAFVAAYVTVKAYTDENGATEANPSNYPGFKALFEGWYKGVEGDATDAETLMASNALAFVEGDIRTVGATINFKLAKLLEGSAYQDEWEELYVFADVTIYAVQAENVAPAKAAELIMAAHNNAETETEWETEEPAGV